MKVLLCIAALSFICQTSKADDFTVDNITYTTLTDTTVAVTASAVDKYTGTLQIPASVTYEDNNYKVTAISARAFFTCNQLTQITFPATITAIGEYAFSGCTSLNNVVLPNGITALQPGTFYGCWSIANISIPGTVTSIGEKAFFNCLRLKSITLPEGITVLGEYAFDHCTNPSEVVLPTTLRIQRGHAFNYCSSLENIKIPQNVYQIDSDPFSSCTALANIDVDKNNTRFTSVDGVLFDANCQKLVCCPCGKSGAYIMPETFITIDEQAFCNRSKLTSITLSPVLTTVGTQAFYGCSQLTELRFPAAMLEIGISAMREMPALKRKYCYATSPPTIYYTTFGTSINNSVPLYVPKRSLVDYENGDYWWRFANILPIDESICVPNLLVFASTATNLDVHLSVAENISALEFDLHLPAGMTSPDGGSTAVLADRCCGDFAVSVENTYEGCWHVKCESDAPDLIRWGGTDCSSPCLLMWAISMRAIMTALPTMQRNIH